MSQIEIEVLKRGTISRNVVSVSFFTMENAYRDFQIYQRKLLLFLGYATGLTDFEVRIYTDDTGKDFVLSVAKNIPYVSVFHYNCPPFREGKGHVGTFGTVVRFLPLFEKDLDLVWVSDVDLNERSINMEKVNLMKKVNADIFISSAFCYQRKPWVGNTLKHPIQAGIFYSKIRFSKQLLTNFLQRIIDGRYDDFIDEINSYNQRRLTILKFPYGMDEYFMNTSIYNSIKRQNVKTIIFKNFFTRNFLVNIIERFPQEDSDVLDAYYKSSTPELFKKVKDMYKRYIPTVIDKYPCAKELLDNMPYFKNTFEVYSLVSSKEL